MARWLTWIGVLISVAAVVIGVWLQVTSGVPGTEGRLLYVEESLLTLGIGLLVIVGARILAHLQSRAPS